MATREKISRAKREKSRLTKAERRYMIGTTHSF